MSRLCWSFIWVLVLISCHKDDGPRIPDPVVLVYPDQNSECITGVSVTDQTSEVTFIWNPAKPAANYTLSVYEIGGELVSRTTTVNPESAVVLRKGVGYSWQVIAANALGEESNPSETWQFYNAGALRSYPPFPADLKSPESGATLVRDNLGAVTLLWSAADADNDLIAFEVRVGLSPETLSTLATLPAEQTGYALEVMQGVRYFWEIVCRDAAGNTSSSGIYDFRVI